MVLICSSLITNGGNNLTIFLPEYSIITPCFIDSSIISFTSNLISRPSINPNPLASLTDLYFSSNSFNPAKNFFPNLYDLSTNFSLDRLLNEKRSSFRFGFEYLVNKHFEVRSGIQMSENNNRFGLGFSVYLPFINISYGILTHPILDNINTLEIKVTFE